MTDTPKRVVTCEFSAEEMVVISVCVGIGASAMHSDVQGLCEGILIMNATDHFEAPMRSAMRKIKTILEQDDRLSTFMKTGDLPS